MRCQLHCPGNLGVIKMTERFEDITEAETEMILLGITEQGFLNSLSKKIKMFYPQDAQRFFPVLKRNLEALIK